LKLIGCCFDIKVDFELKKVNKSAEIAFCGLERKL